LNILDLFKKDEERLESKELKALKLIAKKAYDGNFFDETEVGDVVESETIMSLLHKRLIIRSILKSTFKQEFQDTTWEYYANYLISWLLFSSLDIKNKIIKPVKGRGKGKLNIELGDKSKMIPRSSLKEITEHVPLLVNSDEIVNKRFKRDLLLLDIVNDNNSLTDFGKELLSSKDSVLELRLKEKCLELEKMKALKVLIDASTKITSRKILSSLPHNFFDGEKESSKIIYATKALTWLK